MIWIVSFLVLQSTPSCGFLLWVSESWRTLRNYSTCCFSCSTVLHPIFQHDFAPILPSFFPTGIVGLNFEAFWHHADFQDASSDSEFHAGSEVSRQHPRVLFWPREVTQGFDTEFGRSQEQVVIINQQVPERLEVLFVRLAGKRPWTIQYGMADACSYLLISILGKL